MQKFYYDMHIHSCLSPCGDDDMTPANIAGMAVLNRLNIVALCDHNTTRNCPAFYAECKRQGLIPIAGMELTTAEEIHLVCLFEELDSAISFGREVDENRVKIKNKTEIFGHQYIYDQNDKISGEEEFLLPNATMLSLEQGAELCEKYGGICYPAHIDRPSNGIIAVLGDFPEEPHFDCLEYSDPSSVGEYEKRYKNVKGKRRIVSSDAHHLWNINEAENFFELDDENYSSALMRKRLFELLKKPITGE